MSRTRRYILGPGDMGPKYSALSTDDDDGEPSAKASKPMSQEEFAAWLEVTRLGAYIYLIYIYIYGERR